MQGAQKRRHLKNALPIGTVTKTWNERRLCPLTVSHTHVETGCCGSAWVRACFVKTSPAQVLEGNGNDLIISRPPHTDPHPGVEICFFVLKCFWNVFETYGFIVSWSSRIGARTTISNQTRSETRKGLKPLLLLLAWNMRWKHGSFAFKIADFIVWITIC